MTGRDSVGVKGDKGDEGIPGEPGTPGKTLTQTHPGSRLLFKLICLKNRFLNAK